MSSEINNREYRQKILKKLITQLHDGESIDKVKKQFAAVFEGVSAEEIAQAEQALISNGLPVSEVQRLCDVHAAVFKDSIEEVYHPSDPSEIPGHPVNTMKRENRAIEKLIDEIQKQLAMPDSMDRNMKAASNLKHLTQINSHYLKKENLLFPYLEQYGITAPPKVMWGVDDEIRQSLKEINTKLKTTDVSHLKEPIEELLGKIKEMIFKEESILIPMLLENLTRDEWNRIADESSELGYCLIDNVPSWSPDVKADKEAVQREKSAPGVVTLPTGVLKVEELVRMLDTLPIDITFVDKDDMVKYFSQGAERIFPRTKAVIGRKVSNCHPPASVHIVEKLVEDFKAGQKDSEDFWINMGEKYILIRYFAVRSENGEYLGVLEVTQNIKPIQSIKGEKRLVSE